MNGLTAWIKVVAAGVLSVVVFAALIYAGLSEGEPGPFKALVAATVFIGYVVYQVSQGHLSPRQDTVLAGVVCLIGFGAVAFEVLVNGEQVRGDDVVDWGLHLAAVAILAGWTLLSRRHAE